jgi:hypothetical protein
MGCKLSCSDSATKCCHGICRVREMYDEFVVAEHRQVAATEFDGANQKVAQRRPGLTPPWPRRSATVRMSTLPATSSVAE